MVPRASVLTLPLQERIQLVYNDEMIVILVSRNVFLALKPSMISYRLKLVEQSVHAESDAQYRGILYVVYLNEQLL